MKTKTVTKNRHREREFDIALLEFEDEFGSVLDSDFLDEIAMSEIDDDEE